MQISPITLFLKSIFLLLLLVVTNVSSATQETRPNILIIVADDLGFTDISPYGGEIDTPNLAQLAENGISLSNFHVLPTCAPTRSVLLTGSDNHIAGIGAQLLTDQQRGQPGYEGYISDKTPTIAEVLSNSGYHTYLSGKWHLGFEEGQRPFDRGFEQSFALLPGGASHFSDAIAISPLEPVMYTRNGKVISELPEDFYSTRSYTDSILSWLEQDKSSTKPFFAYLSFTAPHDPLHAPAEYIAKYDGVYKEGYEILRKKRHTNAVEKGLLPETLTLGEWPSIVQRWQSLSSEEKNRRQRDMQTYAAMIDYMDEQIGRIMSWLVENNKMDNTTIIFMSDNGANAFPYSMYPEHTKAYHSQFDNSTENRGLKGSFTELGAGWATASSAGLRLFKAFSTEGGIRTPAIIKPVGGASGRLNHSFIHVQDLMPTLLDITGTAHPSTGNKHLRKMVGRIQTPLFNGDASHHSEPHGVGYELHGTRAFFRDQWKIIQMPIPMGSGEWELFNLSEDPAESINLANKCPDILTALIADHEAYEEEVGVIYEVIGPMAKIAVVVKGIYVVMLLLALQPILAALRSPSRPASLCAFTQLAGVVLLIVGATPINVVLTLTGALGLVWYMLKDRRKLAASLPICIVLLYLTLNYLKSGQVLSTMLG